jgi:hypothetical protein
VDAEKSPLVWRYWNLSALFGGVFGIRFTLDIWVFQHLALGEEMNFAFIAITILGMLIGESSSGPISDRAGRWIALNLSAATILGWAFCSAAAVSISDFWLLVPPPGAPDSERSMLFHLKRICDDPKLNPTGGAVLRQPLEAFMQWLEGECFVEDVWLPSIELKTDIRVKRITFIKICGNIGKHSFARLSVNVRKICEILKANGTVVDEDQGSCSGGWGRACSSSRRWRAWCSSASTRSAIRSTS